MISYLVKRFLSSLLVIFGVLVITFVVSHVIPADPARAVAGLQAGPEQVAAVRHEFGLDRPLPVQFGMYIARLFHGDLGTSIHTRRPVASDLADYLPATIELVLMGFTIAAVAGVLIGVTAAVRRGTWIDHLSRGLSVSGVAMPMFWLALMLQLLFYKVLGWLPFGGRLDMSIPYPHRITGLLLVDTLLAGNLHAWLNALLHSLLPATVLASYPVGMITRLTRSSMLEVLGQQYVNTARAKGLSERVVIYRHALKNALIPVVTVMGLQFGYLLGGDIVVEVIFAWPGMGLYATDAIMTVDFPAIMGATLVIALAYSLVNLAVDLVYAWLDPRVKLS